MSPKRRKISGVPDSEDHVPMPEEAMDMPEAVRMDRKPRVKVTMTLHTASSLSVIERLGIQALLEHELDALTDTLRDGIGSRVTFDVEDMDA